MPLGPLVDRGAALSTAPGQPRRACPNCAARRRDRRVEPIAALKKLIGCPDLASQALDLGAVRPSRRWATRCSARAATPRWCARRARARRWRSPPTARRATAAADPKRGGAQAVAEGWRNLTAVGALPLAITDNMNFGNPEKPEIMGQFAARHRRHAARPAWRSTSRSCRGNVSLYNETNGSGILPTPAIGGVGLHRRCRQDASSLALQARERHVDPDRRDQGASRPVALSARDRRPRGRRAAAGRSRRRAAQRRFRARADPGRQGVAPATMSPTAGSWWRWPRWRWPAASAPILPLPESLAAHAFLFGEDQARYLLVDPRAGRMCSPRLPADVPACDVGKTGGDALTLSDGNAISVAELRRINEAWLPAYMAAGGLPEARPWRSTRPRSRS